MWVKLTTNQVFTVNVDLTEYLTGNINITKELKLRSTDIF